MTASYLESELHTADGTRLFTRSWQPSEQSTLGSVLIAHGYMEHSGRYREVAHALADHGLASVAFDFRGHGKSSGARGYVRHFEDYLDDMHTALSALDDSLPRFILGHSNGALVTLDYVVSRNPQLAGTVVTNPFVGFAQKPPRIKAWIGEMAGKYAEKLSLPSGLSSNDLSHDADIVAAHKRDPLVFHNANAGWFREVKLAHARVCAYERFPTPLFYIYSDSDPIASPESNAHLSQRIDAPVKRVMMRPGELHEVLNESKRADLHHDIAEWMRSSVISKNQSVAQRG